MLIAWIGFVGLVLALLALDLGVFHRKAHVVRVREALVWSGVWVVVALSFAVFVWFGYERHWFGLGQQIDPIDGRINDGTTATLKYLTGYVIEKSLSVDNLFVIAMIFGFLRVPPIHQHRVLFWGILGALAMRGVMIALGAHLVASHGWILYVFGAFLVLTAVKMLFVRGHDDRTQAFVLRLTKRFFPVTDRFHDGRFVVRATEIDGAPSGSRSRFVLTPLAVALVLVETTDLVFAVDSIPAIFAITADPFLVFTSNVFAILGLRSLYFALAGLLDRFRYLKVSLAAVLAIVGAKMLLHDVLRDALGERFNLWLLGLVVLVLLIGVVASLRSPPGPDRAADSVGN